MNHRQTKLEQPLSANLPARDVTLEESVRFSPKHRPLYPKLVILDDRQESGEVLRIRKPSLTIGRTEGDITFPAEGLMSSTHASLSYQELSPKRWGWVLEDNQSRHGLFLRIAEAPLQPGMEFLIGGTKLRIHGDSSSHETAEEQKWSWAPFLVEHKPVTPWKIELLPYLFSQDGAWVELRTKAHSMGRQGDGAESLQADPFVEPIHVHFTRTGSRQWAVKDNCSLNGLWVRVHRVHLATTTEFLLGEQRFRWESC